MNFKKLRGGSKMNSENFQKKVLLARILTAKISSPINDLERSLLVSVLANIIIRNPLMFEEYPQFWEVVQRFDEIMLSKMNLNKIFF